MKCTVYVPTRLVRYGQYFLSTLYFAGRIALHFWMLFVALSSDLYAIRMLCLHRTRNRAHFHFLKIKIQCQKFQKILLIFLGPSLH
jgi:hypothetical protein